MKRKQEKEELLKYVQRILDKDGNAVVDVQLGEGVERYNPLCPDGQKDLSGDIYDYIEAQTNVIPANIPLKIKFHGSFEEDEKEQIKKMMRQHYVMKSFDLSWDAVSNFRKTLLLAIFGAAVIAVYLYLAITGNNVFMTEILSIVGSFSLWEAADGFLLERPHIRREMKNNDQSLNEQIEFVRPADERSGEKENAL